MPTTWHRSDLLLGVPAFFGLRVGWVEDWCKGTLSLCSAGLLRSIAPGGPSQLVPAW